MLFLPNDGLSRRDGLINEHYDGQPPEPMCAIHIYGPVGSRSRPSPGLMGVCLIVMLDGSH